MMQHQTSSEYLTFSKYPIHSNILSHSHPSNLMINSSLSEKKIKSFQESLRTVNLSSLQLPPILLRRKSNESIISYSSTSLPSSPVDESYVSYLNLPNLLHKNEEEIQSRLPLFNTPNKKRSSLKSSSSEKKVNHSAKSPSLQKKASSTSSNSNKSSKNKDVIFRCPHPKCKGEKTFPKLFNLKSHMMSHSNDRPYACRICNNASFQRKHDLQRHVKCVHKSSLPQCKKCKHLFESEKELDIHFQSTHF
ncbi:hypothetical protein HDU92_002954 [Lobulomyces angularis]|nr:hypothetical protein HDU92_002954 [Lobulomyces angularis]